jgi:hypothetical protein
MKITKCDGPIQGYLDTGGIYNEIKQISKTENLAK